MTKPVTKATVAAMLSLTATLACADPVPPFVLTDTDAATVLGGTAFPSFTMAFPSALTVIGGSLEVHWTPGTPANALVPMPMTWTIGGLSGVALWSQFDPAFTDLIPAAAGDGFTFFTAPLAPAALAAPLTFTLGLAGTAVGVYDVHYTVTLALQDGAFTEASAGDTFKVTVSPVPEPATAALWLGGLTGLAALGRRRVRG